MYSLLDKPRVYDLAQSILAPGAESHITGKTAELLSQLPSAQRILDVGCGPSSRLWRFHCSVIGLDAFFRYVATFAQNSKLGVTGSASELPFKDRSFSGVWSFGLLHHLDERSASRAITEMMRVMQERGYLVIFDAVMPRSAWRRPLAWLLRRLDRGANMRKQEVFEGLLADRNSWKCERLTYSWFGHEGVFCVYRKGKADP